MTASDDPVSVVEIYTDPLAVVEIETGGPAGPPGATGPAGATGPQGPTGASGPKSMEFQETWNPETQYDADDYVSWRGHLYLTNGRAEVGTEPSIDGGITVSSGWYLVAREGIQGNPGVTGATGPQGEPGATGPSGASGPPGRDLDNSMSTTMFVGRVPSGTRPVVYHNLGIEWVQVQVFETSDKSLVDADVSIVDANSIMLKIGNEESNMEDGTYTAVILTGYRPV